MIRINQVLEIHYKEHDGFAVDALITEVSDNILCDDAVDLIESGKSDKQGYDKYKVVHLEYRPFTSDAGNYFNAYEEAKAIQNINLKYCGLDEYDFDISMSKEWIKYCSTTSGTNILEVRGEAILEAAA